MTTNDDHGGWQPVPQGGEYDAEATAFVQLPEGMDPSGAPLAAPGHGYVPPMILPLTPAAGTDPAGTGQWSVPQMPQAPGQGQQGARLISPIRRTSPTSPTILTSPTTHTSLTTPSSSISPTRSL